MEPDHAPGVFFVGRGLWSHQSTLSTPLLYCTHFSVVAGLVCSCLHWQWKPETKK